MKKTHVVTKLSTDKRVYAVNRRVIRPETLLEQLGYMFRGRRSDRNVKRNAGNVLTLSIVSSVFPEPRDVCVRSRSCCFMKARLYPCVHFYLQKGDEPLVLRQLCKLL